MCSCAAGFVWPVVALSGNEVRCLRDRPRRCNSALVQLQELSRRAAGDLDLVARLRRCSVGQRRKNVANLEVRMHNVAELWDAGVLSQYILELRDARASNATRAQHTTHLRVLRLFLKQQRHCAQEETAYALVRARNAVVVRYLVLLQQTHKQFDVVRPSSVSIHGQNNSLQHALGTGGEIVPEQLLRLVASIPTFVALRKPGEVNQANVRAPPLRTALDVYRRLCHVCLRFRRADYLVTHRVYQRALSAISHANKGHFWHVAVLWREVLFCGRDMSHIPRCPGTKQVHCLCAAFVDGGHGPRHSCGQIDMLVHCVVCLFVRVVLRIHHDPCLA
eukprot:Rhum_TRINITY_DN16709_c0_g1::Rhum_TRINITY_DN16709_c0_g1_i1::g.164144::m.164144